MTVPGVAQRITGLGVGIVKILVSSISSKLMLKILPTVAEIILSGREHNVVQGVRG